MKYTNTIKSVRESCAKIEKKNNGRIAVVVATNRSARKSSYGIQFWTPEMILMGESKNTDNTVSKFVETL